ncbi:MULTISPECIES: hypothetical protein [Thalassotalea]|uniref:hypothetical protein n=1 Tax=Thalassotalea TaxID=1518149 RepID=UPI000944FF74|nr:MULTISPECIES: hypothetical protein [Thalassotalea]OKY26331.1 hypothetical protein BI291_12160 [Thalassotalea sp. PP2-459]
MHKRKTLFLLFAIAAILLLVYFSSISSSISSIPDSPATAKSKIPEINFANALPAPLDKPSNKLQPSQAKVDKEVIQADESFPDDYIKDCRHALGNHSGLIPDNLVTQYLYRLKKSNTFEDQLSYLLVRKPQSIDEQSKTLQQLYYQQPSSPIINSEILDLCISHKHDSLCSDDILKNIKQTVTNSADLLVKLALVKMKQGMLEETKVLLHEASKKVIYQDESNKALLLIKHSLTKYSDLSEREQIVMTIGYGAAKVEQLGHLNQLCKETNDEEFIETCLTLGKLIEDTAKEVITKLIGLNMQVLAYRYWKNDEMVNLLINKMPANQSVINESEQLASILTFFDENLLREWFNAKMYNSEQFANEQLVKDAILLSKNPDYDPCPT